MASGILPDVEGGILPPGFTVDGTKRGKVAGVPVRREVFPPGWEARLYGRQDARRHNATPRRVPVSTREFGFNHG